MSNKLGIILNGPPGCGKDTIANLMAGSCKKRQFKDALYEHTAKHFEIDLDKFIHYASDRDLKDSRSLAGLGGRTPREALIYISEQIFKPRYGNAYFGECEASRLHSLFGNAEGFVNVVYPDGGFEDEITPVESFFDHVVIIRLHRDGFDFSNDSRSYIYLPDTVKRSSFDVHLKDGDIWEGMRDCMECISIHMTKEII